MKRLTSKDYLKKHEDLLDRWSALEANVTKRLIELIKIYPDAYAPLINYTSKELESYSILGRLKFMEIIEQWAEEQHPHKQLKINF